MTNNMVMFNCKDKGLAMEILQYCLNKIKELTKAWVKENFSNEEGELDGIKHKLEMCISSLLSNESREVDLIEFDKLEKENGRILAQQESKWKMKRRAL